MTSLQGRRILLVEDDFLIARSLVRYLQRAGVHVVGPLGTAAEARVAAETEALDLALLDVTLRDGTSAPVAEVLRTRGVPMAFLTGYAHPPLPPELNDVPRLAKPFDPNDLMDRIPGWIGGEKT